MLKNVPQIFYNIRLRVSLHLPTQDTRIFKRQIHTNRSSNNHSEQDYQFLCEELLIAWVEREGAGERKLTFNI